MKRIFALLFITIILFSVNKAEAQIGHIKSKLIKDKSTFKMKQNAKDALKHEDPYSALFYYEEIVKIDSTDIDSRFQLAELQRITREYSEAEKNYIQVYEDSPNSYPYALYYEAQMQKMSGRYDTAKFNFLAFKKKYDNVGDKEFQKHLQKEIAGCDSAINFMQFPENVKISNLGNSVNHPHIEFSPYLLDEKTLIFGSLRQDSISLYDITYDKKEPIPHRILLSAKLGEDSVWVEQSSLETINDTSTDMGKIVFSKFSENVFFTKCPKNKKDHHYCELYNATYSKGIFTDINKLPESINLTGYTTTQPALRFDSTRNKEVLYFVSDRPDGKGKLDIWYTYFDSRKKEWKTPKNAGGYINSPDDEYTPYYDDSTATLYFSSDGHAGMGGLDVFASQYADGRFSRPKNIGSPLNSPQDDLDFTIGSHTNEGFLTSNRPGGTAFFHETCCDDIYYFKRTPKQPFKVDLTVTISFKPDTTTCDIEFLEMLVTDLKTNETRIDTVKLVNCEFTFPLDPEHKYKSVVSKPGYKNDSLVVITGLNSSDTEIVRKITLTKKEEPKIELPETPPTEEKPFVLKDLNYEYNSADLTEKAKSTLDSIMVVYMNKNAEIKVQVNAHTDDVGSKGYNQNLSQQRANNVVKYLVEKGIDNERLTAKGYGESKPIAPNKSPDGSDNPIGRSMNRRTEFVVLEK